MESKKLSKQNKADNNTQKKELDIIYLPRGVANTEDFEEVPQSSSENAADNERFENPYDKSDDPYALNLNTNESERNERMIGLEKEISRIASEAGSLEDELREVEDSEDSKALESLAEKYRLSSKYDKDLIVTELKDLLAERVTKLNELGQQKRNFSQDYIEVSKFYSGLEQNIKNFSDVFDKKALSSESIEIIKKIDSLYLQREVGFSYRLNCGKKSSHIYSPERFEVSKNGDYRLIFYDFRERRFYLKLKSGSNHADLYHKNKKIGRVTL